MSIINEKQNKISFFFQQLNEIVGYIVSAVFWLTSMGVTIGITSSGHYGLMILDMGDGFADIYIKPWTRIGPYIIGMVAGYLLYKYRFS